MNSTNWLLVITLISYNLLSSEGNSEYEALKVIGGIETEADQFKYVVGVGCYENGCSCTGSIIDERFVITAAHCFFDSSNGAYTDSETDPITIVAGTNDVLDHDNPRRVERSVEKIYAPAGYVNLDYLGYDIAVLRLNDSLQLEANNLEKLRLPVKTKSRFAGQQAVLLGFGYSTITYTVRRNGTVEAVGDANGKLHAANVSIVTNDKCNKSYITDVNLCGQVIGEKKAKLFGGCDGDSGGPLVYKSKVLIAVFTHGRRECNERSNYGIYQRVQPHLDFIHRAMNDDTSDMFVKSWN